jgi:hypothetical protein
LPSSTTSQSTPTLRAIRPVRRDMKGTIGISVFSVYSCWLPRITARNPTG